MIIQFTALSPAISGNLEWRTRGQVISVETSDITEDEVRGLEDLVAKGVLSSSIPLRNGSISDTAVAGIAEDVAEAEIAEKGGGGGGAENLTDVSLSLVSETAPQTAAQVFSDLRITDSILSPEVFAFNKTAISSYNSDPSVEEYVERSIQTPNGSSYISSGSGVGPSTSEAYLEMSASDLGSNSNFELGIYTDSDSESFCTLGLTSNSQVPGLPCLAEISMSATTCRIQITGDFHLETEAPVGAEAVTFSAANAPEANLEVEGWVKVTIGGRVGYLPWFSVPLP